MTIVDFCSILLYVSILFLNIGHFSRKNACLKPETVIRPTKDVLKVDRESAVKEKVNCQVQLDSKAWRTFCSYPRLKANVKNRLSELVEFLKNKLAQTSCNLCPSDRRVV